VVDFPAGGQKISFREGSSGENSFYQLETKRKHFSTVRLIRKYQTSKISGTTTLPYRPSDVHGDQHESQSDSLMTRDITVSVATHRLFSFLATCATAK